MARQICDHAKPMVRWFCCEMKAATKIIGAAGVRGLNDNRSAIGTKVEVFCGREPQKWEIAGSSGYLGQSSSGDHGGVGRFHAGRYRPHVVADGVLQDEIEVAGDKQQEFIEIDRRGSSCLMFVWDGTKYRLMRMCSGRGAGAWVGSRGTKYSATHEYVKIDRNAIQRRDASSASA